MQTTFENIPSISVVYMRRIGPYGEQNYKLMQDMKQWIQKYNLWDENSVIYGIAQDNIAITVPEKCRYDVCFVTDSIFTDNNIHHGTLPTGIYLVCEVLHTANEVQCFYAALDNILSKKGKRFDESRPILERYQFALVEKGYCEFCIPILDF